MSFRFEIKTVTSSNFLVSLDQIIPSFLIICLIGVLQNLVHNFTFLTDLKCSKLFVDSELVIFYRCQSKSGVPKVHLSKAGRGSQKKLQNERSWGPSLHFNNTRGVCL